ncbi:PREDICTED: early light-induced protein 1, chloroplastic [Camelina sativa]|uniref:Early light-induced protein 1, chloroplastic n=1 Tax=Camelina sativa TaxID=90675 RepID=A0ABM0XN00_CAMSA|nr:PREDICTED: early light-induced protein 1, chloroplastic [Camelina sativa]
MATASFNMQSVFAGGLTTTRKINSNKLFSAGSFPNLKRNYPVGVRCMAEGEPKKEDSTATPATSALPKSPSPPPPMKPKVSTKFSDLLAFSGPAPERINGRLAMVGFVAALAVELSKGENVLSQISDGGVSWFLGTTAILTLASLVPLFKGITVESKSKGIMTSDAELWNGRFAMLGLVALAFTEFVKGGTLV